jgi:hypothetical protein
MDEKSITKGQPDDIHAIDAPSQPEVNPIAHGMFRDTSLNSHTTKIHPQPTSDPLDPLNWSRFQKNAVLSIVMLK